MLSPLRQTYGPSQSPCPHCDMPLERAQAGQRRLVCPHCRGALQPLFRPGNLRRILAAILDIGIVFVLSVPWLLFLSIPQAGDTRGLLNRILDTLALGIPATLWTLWPLWLLSGVYFATCTLFFGRSGGQHLLALRVVDQEGLIPSPSRCSWRACALVLSNLPMGLGFLWSLVDASGRSLHDHLSKTYVIRSL